MKKIVILALVFALSSFCVSAYNGVADWAAEEISAADSNGLVPSSFESLDFAKKINRAEFAQACVTLYEKLTGKKAVMPEVNPFIDTDSTVVTKAYELGVINGVTNVTFVPNADVTREQAAAMLKRTIVKSGFEVYKPDENMFVDDNNISDWAKQDVYSMRAMGLINGKEGGAFAPADGMTVQETLIVSNRAYVKITTPEVEEPEETSLLSQIPVISFGDEPIAEETENSASITVTGATLDDYKAYIEAVEVAYPTVDNIFPNQFIIANNGINTINVTFGNGKLVVTLTKGVN